MTSPSANRRVPKLEGAALQSQKVEAAKVDAACAGRAFATPANDEVAPLNIHVSVELSSVFAQPLRLCLLLDGARLLTTDDAAAAARRLATGEVVTIRAGATPTTQHDVVVVAYFDGLDVIRGYHFRLQSHHEFVIAGRERRDGEVGGPAVLGCRGVAVYPVVLLARQRCAAWLDV
jgi:hypothetical protein